MTVKRKDFQKTATYIHEFLLKLFDDAECAELRDALNLALLHMQKYYCRLQVRNTNGFNTGSVNGSQSASSNLGTASLRGLSPMTPFSDSPDKWLWPWVSMEHPPHRLSRSLNFVEKQGISPGVPEIHQACKIGDQAALDRLYAHDPECLTAVDGLGRSPLMYAVYYGQSHLIKWLIEHKQDPNFKANDNSTALHRACHIGNVSAVEILLEHRADINVQDWLSRSPVHWAVTTPTTQCLKLLIKKKANVNVRDQEGLSPSMWACRLDNYEHFDIISKVANQKIDEPDGIERDQRGKTWLHWAVRRTEPVVCLKKLLTEENAVLRDDFGKTVFLLAAETGSLPSTKVIVERLGRDVINDKDDEGRSPLHLATIGGHGEVVNYLLENGADLDKRDLKSSLAWDYAHARSLHYCILIIASHYRQRYRGEGISKDMKDAPQPPKDAPYPKLSLHRLVDSPPPDFTSQEWTSEDQPPTSRRFLSSAGPHVPHNQSPRRPDNNKEEEEEVSTIEEAQSYDDKTSHESEEEGDDKLEDEPDFESRHFEEDAKPPRPPTTPPPIEKITGGRRYMKRQEPVTTTTETSAPQPPQSRANKSDCVPQSTVEASPTHSNDQFDRKESEDLDHIPDAMTLDPLNMSASGQGLQQQKQPSAMSPPAHEYGRPPKTARGRPPPQHGIDVPPGAGLVQTGEALEAITPNRQQLQRTQPPARIGSSNNSSNNTSPRTRQHGPYLDNDGADEDSYRGQRATSRSPPPQPPLTPPEAKRKPVLPPQLMPLSMSGLNGSVGGGALPSSRREHTRGRRKKKTRNNDGNGILDTFPDTIEGNNQHSGYRQLGVTAPLSPPNQQIPGYSNGPTSSSYTRPLQPPGMQTLPYTAPNESRRSGGNGGRPRSNRLTVQEKDDVEPALSPRGFTPPHGFRNGNVSGDLLSPRDSGGGNLERISSASRQNRSRSEPRTSLPKSVPGQQGLGSRGTIGSLQSGSPPSDKYLTRK